mmetsp:Transcript_25751/g.43953  ORF Transcript_25751/g.43953 Transcript_25751/m.43953 type:complete len:251 (+) Transcript_25751:94-846(+)
MSRSRKLQHKRYRPGFMRFGVQNLKERSEVSKASFFCNLLSASLTGDNLGIHRTFRSMTPHQRVDVLQTTLKHAPRDMMIPPNMLNVLLRDSSVEEEKVIGYDYGCVLSDLIGNLEVHDGLKRTDVYVFSSNIREYVHIAFERSRCLEDTMALKDAAKKVLHPETCRPKKYIFVKAPSDKTMSITFDPSRKICDVKNEVAGRLAVIPDAFNLRIEGRKPLHQTEFTLSDYNIQVNANLIVDLADVRCVQQ